MKTLLHLSLVEIVVSVATLATAAEIDVFFSPKGGCQAAIIKHIDQAENEILVAAYSFTAKPIGDALLRAAKRGVQVHLVVDRRQPTAHHSQIPRLAKAGIPTRVDRQHHLMHQKLLIIDRRFLIAGSYNFSSNAETRNVEILLVIDDATTAKIARSNWSKTYTHADPLNQPTIHVIKLSKPLPPRLPSCGPRGPPDHQHTCHRRPVRRVLRFLILRRPFRPFHYHRHRRP